MAESWSATRYTAPVRVKEYFKDRTGPYSMPHDYLRVLRALALTCPMNCTRA